MDQHSYKETIRQYLLPFLKKNPETDYIFQQDGVPCHTSKMMKQFFEDDEIMLLEWAAQSLDLNPIEHVWAIIKRELEN